MSRRKSRVAAFEALFEYDLVGHNPELVLSRLVEEGVLSQEAENFAQELVKGVMKHRVRIDATIRDYALAFPLSQISPVDRNILRLAVFEILIYNEVPLKVAANEAVELAKAFGSDNSTRFINGVLGSVISGLKVKEV
jgi:N utilization substance protein B